MNRNLYLKRKKFTMKLVVKSVKNARFVFELTQNLMYWDFKRDQLTGDVYGNTTPRGKR